MTSVTRIGGGGVGESEVLFVFPMLQFLLDISVYNFQDTEKNEYHLM